MIIQHWFKKWLGAFRVPVRPFLGAMMIKTYVAGNTLDVYEIKQIEVTEFNSRFEKSLNWILALKDGKSMKISESHYFFYINFMNLYFQNPPNCMNLSQSFVETSFLQRHTRNDLRSLLAWSCKKRVVGGYRFQHHSRKSSNMLRKW